jgi:hypothetical protein
MLFWKALVFPPLWCAGAFGLLDVSDPAVVKMLEMLDDVGKKISMPNTDYATWVARDQFVQGWLNNSIFPDILAYVLDAETMAKTWAIISAMFKSTSNESLAPANCCQQHQEEGYDCLIVYLQDVWFPL